MKFSEQLEALKVPEWKDFYMDYEGLKAILDKFWKKKKKKKDKKKGGQEAKKEEEKKKAKEEEDEEEAQEDEEIDLEKVPILDEGADRATSYLSTSRTTISFKNSVFTPYGERESEDNINNNNNNNNNSNLHSNNNANDDFTNRAFEYLQMGLYLPQAMSLHDQRNMMSFFDELLFQVKKVEQFYMETEEEIAKKVDTVTIRQRLVSRSPHPHRHHHHNNDNNKNKMNNNDSNHHPPGSENELDGYHSQGVEVSSSSSSSSSLKMKKYKQPGLHHQNKSDGGMKKKQQHSHHDNYHQENIHLSSNKGKDKDKDKEKDKGKDKDKDKEKNKEKDKDKDKDDDKKKKDKKKDKEKEGKEDKGEDSDGSTKEKKKDKKDKDKKKKDKKKDKDKDKDGDKGGNDVVDELAAELVAVFRKEQMLMNFVSLNYTGFDKLMKKFDKMAGCNCRLSFRARLACRYFVESEVLGNAITRTIEIYARQYHQGNTGHAETELRNKIVTATVTNPPVHVGIKYGVALALVIFVLYRALTKIHPSFSEMMGSYEVGYHPIYQLVLLLLVLLWLWGFCLWFWNKYHINYVYIFEFNPGNHADAEQIWNEASNLTTCSIVNFMIFQSHPFIDQVSGAIDLPTWLYPISLLVYFLVRNTWGVVSPAASQMVKKTLLPSIAYALTSPFGRMRLRDIFAGEVLTSLTKLFFDFIFVMAFYLYVLFFPSSAPHFHRSYPAEISDLFTTITTTGETPLSPTSLDDGWTTPTSISILSKFWVFRNLMVPIIYCIPLFARMMQCAKFAKEKGDAVQLLNVTKYFLAMCVVVVGALSPIGASKPLFDAHHVTYFSWFICSHVHIVWMTLCLALTLFSAFWDCRVDWGLLTFGVSSKEHDLASSISKGVRNGNGDGLDSPPSGATEDAYYRTQHVPEGKQQAQWDWKAAFWGGHKDKKKKYALEDSSSHKELIFHHKNQRDAHKRSGFTSLKDHFDSVGIDHRLELDDHAFGDASKPEAAKFTRHEYWLRAHLMFYRPWVYYCCMIGNIVLRLNWCIVLTPFALNTEGMTYVLPLLVLLEVFRRFIWALFFIENMHVRNRVQTKRGGGGFNAGLKVNVDLTDIHNKLTSVPVLIEVARQNDEEENNRTTNISIMKDLLLHLAIFCLFALLHNVHSGFSKTLQQISRDPNNIN